MFLTLKYMEQILGPEFLAGLHKNPEYTRAGVDRLYCIVCKDDNLSLQYIEKF